MAAAKKSAAKNADENQQEIVMVGASYGNEDGQRRTVDPELAASLVDRGLARYPDSE